MSDRKISDIVRVVKIEDAANAKYLLLDPDGATDTDKNPVILSSEVQKPLDGSFQIKNTADVTKIIDFDASGITTSNIRTITMPDADVDLGDIPTGVFGLAANATINFTAVQTAAQMQALIDAATKNLNGYTLTFQFADGSYTAAAALTFQGFGNGTLYIKGNAGESGLHTNQAAIIAGTDHHGIVIKGCDALVYTSNIRMDLTVTTDYYSFLIESCPFAEIKGCYGNHSDAYGAGIRLKNGVIANIEDNYVTGGYHGIEAETFSNIQSKNNDDTGTQPVYGIASLDVSRIYKSGTQPDGSTANERLINNGTIQ